MFQNLLKKITKNVNTTKEQISKSVNKEFLSEKYDKLLNNPKLKNITNVNSQEYKQQMNHLKQTINDKKKEYEKEFNELKKNKPSNLNLSGMKSKFENLYANKKSYFNNLPFSKKLQMNRSKQNINDKKKENDKEFNEQKKKTPSDLKNFTAIKSKFQNLYANKRSFFNNLTFSKKSNNKANNDDDKKKENKKEINELKNKSTSEFKNFTESKSEFLNSNANNKFSFDEPYVSKQSNNKTNNNDEKANIFTRFSSYKSSKNNKLNFYNKNPSNTFYEKLKDKVLNVNYFKNKLKFKAYLFIFYIFAFVVLVKSIKYFFGKLFFGSNPNDEKYENIIKSLENLKNQNEELRKMNGKLLESKSTQTP